MDDRVLSETVTITGDGGAQLEAYSATPLDRTPRGGVVVIHHMPGYDKATKEMVRRFAAEGYNAVCPNLYTREAPGAAPDDAAATARSLGGVPDERLVGDVAGAAAYLRGLENSNGRVGVIGHCSGGRQAFLSGCSLDLQAAVDCYGAFVTEAVPEGLPLRVGPIGHLAKDLSCPLLGLFGEEDKHPSPEAVAELERLLTEAGKEFEFHTFAGAGHAFFAVDRPSYRPDAATEGWKLTLDFFARNLA
ncbi:dienelactone hydrolase family protein [Streptacidiphilus albus]|uniref:dienelactone hydrolase family protein n=1 Tax=Streptacidiphilus albus TaxID=105425 RepID=UPI00054B59E1|nr:dienelactone hydrolase family protein [Streptacidiphilus albus]